MGEILAIWAPRFQITSDLRFVIWSTWILRVEHLLRIIDRLLAVDCYRDPSCADAIFLGSLQACVHMIRDAEMTIKIFLERSSQKGVGEVFEKGVNRGPTLKFFCRPKSQEKQHFGKLHLYCHRRHFYFSHRPSPFINPTLRSNTLQGVDFGSILGQFLVSLGQKRPKTDRKPTQN